MTKTTYFDSTPMDHLLDGFIKKVSVDPNAVNMSLIHSVKVNNTPLLSMAHIYEQPQKKSVSIKPYDSKDKSAIYNALYTMLKDKKVEYNLVNNNDALVVSNASVSSISFDIYMKSLNEHLTHFVKELSIIRNTIHNSLKNTYKSEDTLFKANAELEKYRGLVKSKATDYIHALLKKAA